MKSSFLLGLPLTSIGSRCSRCRFRLLATRSITSFPRPTFAAPEIDFSNRSLPPPNIENARIVPTSPSYFTAEPIFTDNFLHLQKLLRQWQTLPTVPQNQVPRVAWRSSLQYRVTVGETIPYTRYQKMIHILQRLNQIVPSMRPPELVNTLDAFKRDVDPFENVPKPGLIDADGRAYGIGRRKSSSAKVCLVQGEGEVLVNGKSIIKAFGRIHDRESALWALKATDRIDKYNVWALASGGGTTGQAEAITLGLAKALMVHEPDLKPALRRAGCVTRNPKRVERKKTGHLKARKMPAWVKR